MRRENRENFYFLSLGDGGNPHHAQWHPQRRPKKASHFGDGHHRDCGGLYSDYTGYSANGLTYPLILGLAN